jgi:methyltransferase (TIGR00027 family)
MPASPTHIVRQGLSSRTALVVASLRAVHQLIDEPLVLPDRLALPLLGPPAEAALRDDPFVLNDPLSRGLRAALVVRSRFVEDELARCVAAGVRQYVVLGAGLDTFACRDPYHDAGLRVFEVDHPGTQGWKQRMLAEAVIDVPPSLSFVAVDFEHDDLFAALARSGFRSDQPACIGWMGVTMYLTTTAVLATLGTLASFASGSCLCFDYRLPAAMLDPMTRAVSDIIEQRAAALGEPWLSSFDPVQLQEHLLELGFSSAKNVTSDELNLRYLARRKDGLRMGKGVRIMCANR